MAKTFFGKLLAAIGGIFKPAFKGAEKAYNELTPEQQQALKDGSGMIDFINKRLDTLPGNLRAELIAQFPNQDIAKIEKTAFDVGEAFGLIKAGEASSLEDLIIKLQAFLKAKKEKGGKFWAHASFSLASLFAILFGPPEAKVSVVTSLLEYVYHKFIKKD